MKFVTLPIIRKSFQSKIGKTAIEVQLNGNPVTVWANGNMEERPELLVNVVVNEVGDKFVASKDSSTLDDKKKPVYLKGATVVRKKESYEFKSLTGGGQASQFAQAASAFNLSLNVVMQG